MGFGRRIHDRFESDPGDVLRHQQPRAGKPVGRARGARVRAGTSRSSRMFEQLNRDYIDENLRLAQDFGAVQSAADGADRHLFSAGAVDGRIAAGGAQNLAGQLRHVQHLHGNAGVADDRDGLGGEPDGARPGIARARFESCWRSGPESRAPAKIALGSVSPFAARSSCADVTVRYGDRVALDRCQSARRRRGRRSPSWDIPAAGRARWRI